MHKTDLCDYCVHFKFTTKKCKKHYQIYEAGAGHVRPTTCIQDGAQQLKEDEDDA